MFDQTIDNKPYIVDNKGNEIVNFAKSIFAETAQALEGYSTIKMDEGHQMRPDKVSFDVYGSINYAEMVLKYSGISNPFSLSKDDVLMIPEYNTIYAQLAKDVDENNDDSQIEKIKNYFKFTSTYKPDQSSYKELANKNINSGIKTPDEGDYMVPYISDDGKTAITIRNGRMYFGEDAGNSAATTNLDEKIQNLINSTATAIADQCAMNGLSLTDFVRASTKNNE